MRVAAGIVLAMALAGAARADDDAPKKEGVVLTLGAQGSVGPTYDGARTSLLRATPFVDIHAIGETRSYYTPDDGIDYSMVDLGWLKIGPVGRFRDARTSEDHHELNGLRPIDTTLEFGGVVELWPTDWLRLRGELRKGFFGHTGFVADLGGDVVGRLGAFTAPIGPRFELGDKRFTATYFSISGPESVATGGRLAPFAAHGGLTSAGLLAAIRYDFPADWSATLYGQYARLTGDAARSTLTRTIGSRDALTAGVVLTRAFTIERFW